MAPKNNTGSPVSLVTSGTKTANSFTHQRDGQNVAFGDIHVDFDRLPNVGQNSDNIFTANGGIPSAVGTAITPSPTGVPSTTVGGTSGAYDVCFFPMSNAATPASSFQS